jgi:hypothetical protein
MSACLAFCLARPLHLSPIGSLLALGIDSCPLMLSAAHAASTLAGQSNRVVTLWNQQGMRSGFALDIRTCDAVPTAMCTAVQYEADMRGAEATHTVKVVRTMHGYLVANGELHACWHPASMTGEVPFEDSLKNRSTRSTN